MINELRIVDIQFPASLSYGSGYLLSDRLILTARHVAKPDALGTECLARRWDLTGEPLRGRVKWRSPRRDAALIALEDPVADALGPDPMFGRLPADRQGQPYPCEAVGFPRASRNKARIDKRMSGTARPLIRERGMFDIDSQLRPATAELWSGFSGAAVFSRGLLFALVATVPEGWAGGSLNATAIDPLWGEPGFAEALAEHGLADPRLSQLRHVGYYPAMSKRLVGHYPFVDREDQAKRFEEHCGGRSGRTFFLTSVDDDRPDWLMIRFARDDRFRRLFGDVSADRAIFQLPWPGFDAAGQAGALEQLGRQAAEGLSLPPGAAADPASFAAAIQQRGAAALWWQIDPHRMGPGHSALLRAWVDFCAEVQRQGVPFYCFCCWLESEPPTPSRFSFRRPPAPDPDVAAVIEALIAEDRLVDLGQLQLIELQRHVLPWLSDVQAQAKLEPEFCQELRARIDIQLEARMHLGGLPRSISRILESDDA